MWIFSKLRTGFRHATYKPVAMFFELDETNSDLMFVSPAVKRDHWGFYFSFAAAMFALVHHQSATLVAFLNFKHNKSNSDMITSVATVILLHYSVIV